MSSCSCCCRSCVDYADKRDGMPIGINSAFRWAMKWYAWLLKKWQAKVVVVLVTLGMAGAFAYGASQIKQDFQFRWFVPDDNPLQEVFDIQDTYFGNVGAPTTVVVNNADHSDAATQLRLMGLAAHVDSCAGCAKQWTAVNSTVAFYEPFFTTMQTCDDSGLLYGVPCATLGYATPYLATDKATVATSTYHANLHNFVTNGAGSMYASLVLWNDDNNPALGLRVSRLRVDTVALTEAVDQIQVLCVGGWVVGCKRDGCVRKW